ncbi:MAG: hypothetical protein ACKO0V_00935, partial [bacterium]
QKQEICRTEAGVWDLLAAACRELGVNSLEITTESQTILAFDNGPARQPLAWHFDLPCESGSLTTTIALDDQTTLLDPDIIYRYVLRMIRASIHRVEYMKAFSVSEAMAAEPENVRELTMDLRPNTIDNPAMEAI